jgi:hypothetical protein
VTSDKRVRTEIRKSKLENRGEFRFSSFGCSSLVTALSAFLGSDRKERAKLLLNFPALAFGASDPLLIVFGHGQDEGESFLARFACIFVTGHIKTSGMRWGGILTERLISS